MSKKWQRAWRVLATTNFYKKILKQLNQKEQPILWTHFCRITSSKNEDSISLQTYSWINLMNSSERRHANSKMGTNISRRIANKSIITHTPSLDNQTSLSHYFKIKLTRMKPLRYNQRTTQR